MPRTISVEIVGDASSLEKSFKKASQSSTKFSQSLKVSLGSLVKGTLVVGAVSKSVDLLSGAISSGIDEWKQSAQVAAQTAAVLKSTGGVAGVSAKHVDQLATSIMKYSGIDDEAIASGENLLLTFTNIRNVVGKGNDVFDQTTRVLADMSTALGQDTKSSALQLGKALNDPVKGVTALQRVGVSFTESQKDQIKQLVATGHTLEAQKLILRELTKEFGGSAKAAGQTLPGQLNILKQSFSNFAGNLVGKVAPALAGALSGINDFVDRFSKARTVHAKLQVVWEGLRNLGRDLYNAVRDGINAAVNLAQRIDWGALGHRIGQRAHELASALGDAIRSVNWSAVLQRAGQILSGAVVKLLDLRTTILNKIPWQNVGRYIVRGLVLAVGAVVKLVASIDWVKVVKALVRTFIATLRAQANLFIGIGKEILKLLGQGISAGLEVLKAWLEPTVLKLALILVEPFTHLPKKLGGGPFQDLKAQWQQTLDDLAAAGRKGGEAAGKAVSDGINAGLDPAKQIAATARAAAGAAGAAAAGTQPPAAKPPGGGGSGAAAAAAAKGFELPFRLRLEQAKAEASGVQAQIVQAARDIVAFVRSQLPKLKGEKLIQAYGELANATGTLTGAAHDAAQKAADAATAAIKALDIPPKVTGSVETPGLLKLPKTVRGSVDNFLKTSYEEPLRLQLELARRQAHRLSLRPVLLQMLAAAKKALASGKLAVEGQIDAWNEIDSLNQQLKDAADGARKVKPKFETFYSGGHLVHYRPGQQTVLPQLKYGVAGLPLPAATGGRAGAYGGRAVYNIQNLNLHGVQDVRGLENQLTRRSQQRPQTRRGPV